MKKSYLFSVLHFVLFTPTVFSHPGIGIVQDKYGNIFYTDLFNVWMIDAAGNKSIVVPSVHTHELSLDPANNLFGEHLWYNGEQLKTWGHFIWKRNADGKIELVKDSSTGFVENYGFMRDAAGNQYWLQRWAVSRFKKKSRDGKIITVAEVDMNNILWQHVSADGEIFFTDHTNLYRIRVDGKVQTLAHNLSRSNSMMGIWTDRFKHVYWADYAARQVKTIDSTGTVSVVASTSGDWSPSGGLIDKEGNLWVLENSSTNEVRVEKFLLKKPSAILPMRNESSNAVQTRVWTGWSLLTLTIIAIVLVALPVFRRRNIK